MKKFLLSLAVILGFGLYALGLSRQSKASPAATTTSPTNTTTTPTPATTDPAQNNSVTTNPPPTSTTYKNGSFTSSVQDAFYGNVQIRTTIKAGQITDIQFLQYPNDRGNSIEINNYAMPLLKQEAISAQSANVDIVSGATATSQAFQQALADTLAQAKA